MNHTWEDREEQEGRGSEARKIHSISAHAVLRTAVRMTYQTQTGSQDLVGFVHHLKWCQRCLFLTCSSRRMRNSLQAALLTGEYILVDPCMQSLILQFTSLYSSEDNLKWQRDSLVNTVSTADSKASTLVDSLPVRSCLMHLMITALLSHSIGRG